MSDPNHDDYDANAEECMNWQYYYLSEGKSRQVLIAWLTARPQDANLIVGDILKFLQTERLFLEDDRKPLGSFEKQDIYNMYVNGDFMGFGKIDGWDKLLSKKKIYEISKAFPEYLGKESRLENIISEQKAKRPKK
tara:strand:- start:154 stop:561 length:408 start_codon:yes stop_codon:yes gene_type:complete